MFRILKIIHLTAGLVGALLILLLSITGILLNHRTLIGYILTIVSKFQLLFFSLLGLHTGVIESSSTTQLKFQEFVFGLHSGTIGNTSIVWLTDIGALCMIVLSVTGVWMWVKVILRKNTHVRRRKKHE